MIGAHINKMKFGIAANDTFAPQLPYLFRQLQLRERFESAHHKSNP